MTVAEDGPAITYDNDNEAIDAVDNDVAVCKQLDLELCHCCIFNN